jgi:serine phosphatase RsbU (regulator of sigma subunit)
VTAIVSLLDPTSGRCLLSSAGHPSPVLVSRGEVSLLEPRYGPPLGTFDLPYDAREFTIAPGEALVLYTDGLTEARGREGFFGEQRLLEAVRDAQKGDPSPNAVIERLRDSVLAHAGTLGDDFEILVVRRVEQGADGQGRW